VTQLSEADSIYGKVKNVLARMSRREIYMALLWVFIGLMLLAAIILIIYFKFVKKPSQ
jgi:ABC-type multidrug transport system permease subunit